jgi:hypothetical protein
MLANTDASRSTCHARLLHVFADLISFAVFHSSSFLPSMQYTELVQLRLDGHMAMVVYVSSGPISAALRDIIQPEAWPYFVLATRSESPPGEKIRVGS